MLPQFLVIGAQKSGTTWLDRNLRTNRKVWLPPEKELHYFDLPKNIPFIFFALTPNRGDRVWVIRQLKKGYKQIIAKRAAANWYLRYHLLPRTDRWYSSLFTPNEGQIAGEVTPHYAIMDDKKIAKIHELVPEIKLVYLLRNPIDRMWSHAAMQFSGRFGGKGIEQADEKTIIKFLSHPKNLVHARYFENLQRWEKYFSPEQMFIACFEDIANRPDQLLLEILQFLGVAVPKRYASRRAKQKIFARDYPDIPNYAAYHLAELLIDDLEKLHQRLDTSYTTEWLASAQSYLQQKN